ncbi:hypothetical protein [Burkholderia cepacia]|uniref:hypothetical protein n=1 Tax=Burkholderia cepacia TaxID=292 RepID=UPI00075D3C2A|nr:hypothetical protein [Burkholderia cepacia]KVK90323.1 hypothetical protein WS93_35855 [Burkholderia cepacia]
MDTNELKLAQAKLESKNLVISQVFTTVRFLAICCTVGASIYFIMTGLHGQSEGSIAAFAKVVDAMKLGSVLGYGWGVVATGAYIVERSRKKK